MRSHSSPLRSLSRLLRLASPLANTTTVALCLVVVVLFVARTRSGPAALVASLASMLALNFFFLPPVGTLTIADPLNWIALAVFLAVALTVGELSSRANRQTAQARAHQLEAERLYRELQAAVDREAQTEAERRSERLKSALLDAVTHNLRTPITSIKASTTALLSESATMGDAIKRELLMVANEEADRLDLLVEDLIDLARIEAGELGLQVSWCSLEDVIGGAIKRAERLFGARTLDVTIAARSSRHPGRCPRARGGPVPAPGECVEVFAARIADRGLGARRDR